tara:strand:+ start:1232 stop:2338 length:1107 start_codon:yes stop_codon:yes gene_type:complete
VSLFVDILFVIFVFTIFTQLLYALFFFIRLSFYKEKSNSFNKGISVIICAKNEADMLSVNLPSFLEQDYPKYEVIVVDDQSEDGTKYILKDLEKKYFNLKVVTIDPHVISRIGKKFPLSIGIKTAKYDYVLLTDADCKAHSKNWINKMTSSFESKEIVLGISPHKKTKGILNKFIRFDEFIVMLQYLSYALAKIPYMGVGRNLAYKKSLFFSVKGFASHIHIPSGDDDLFIKEVATKDNVAIQIHKDADIFTQPKITFSDWFYQRKRHISTSKYYKNIHKGLLFLFPFSQFLFWISSIILFVFHPDLIIICSLFTFRIVLYYFLYFPIMKKLRHFDLFFIYPVMEFLSLFVQLFFVLLNKRYKTNSWK